VKTSGGELTKELVIQNDDLFVSDYEQLSDDILITTNKNI